jgi:adenylyltransferase/sulfurtransferase
MATTSVRTFTPEQVQRYSRHIIMPQVGSAGQRKLMEASVLCVGAGGLGSPLAMYLAAAGVGKIGVVDFDVVDITNLQRQLLHRTDSIGKPKVDSAAETLEAINPNVEVVKLPVHLNSENAMDVIKDYDILVDGTDNFPTRYLINDAGVMAVLGVLPGIIGSLMAIEAMKLTLGIGKPLVNRLLMFDALDMEFHTVKIRRDPECPVCGDNPTISELIDYEAFCGMPAVERS